MSGAESPMCPEDPLIAAATRPLAANPEQHFSAAGFLESVRKTDPQAEQAAIARWAEVDGRKPMVSWKVRLGGLVAIVSFGVAITDLWSVLELIYGRNLGGREERLEKAEACIARNQSIRRMNLLFGDSTTHDISKRKEALWSSQPDDPALLSEYLSTLKSQGLAIPGPLLERGRRIDPDNAWFDYLELSQMAGSCVIWFESPPKYMSGRRVTASSQWKVTNEQRFGEVIRRLFELREKQRVRCYRSELLKRRIPLLPQSDSEQFRAATVILEEEMGMWRHDLTGGLADFMLARAWFCGESGDASAFHEASVDAEMFLRSLFSEDPCGLSEVLIHAAHAKRISKAFAVAAGKLGLEAEKCSWDERYSGLSARDHWVDRRIEVDGIPQVPGVKTEMLAGMRMQDALGFLDRQPRISEWEVRPLRLADHEIASRLLCYLLWMVLFFLIGVVSAFHYRFPRMLWKLADRIEQQLRLRDWIWISGLGLLAPLVYVLGINRFTTLGGRSFGLLGSHMILPAGHFLALLLFWLLVPPVVIRWRLKKRVGFFGFGRGGWIAGFLPVAMLGVFVPVVGWAAITGDLPDDWKEVLGWDMPTIDGRASGTRLWAAAALVAPPLLWLPAVGLVALIGGGIRGIERLVVSRAMLTVLGLAMIVALGMTPLFKLAERHWFSRDTLMKLDPAEPGWSRFEYRIAVQMHNELRGILGFSK